MTLASILDVASDHPFSSRNLPYGVFEREGEAHPCTAIGEHVLDLHVIARAGLLDGAVGNARELFGSPTLNALLAAGQRTWRSLRARLIELLAPDNTELTDASIVPTAFSRRDDARMLLPITVTDYVDFYSSLEHATNMGKLFRPGGDPLTPNWRYLPIAYHGRAGGVVVSGTPVTRPAGQWKTPEMNAPMYAPSRMLDFELELAFVTGNGPSMGTRVAPNDAEKYIFGVALLNDWSARDIQSWEYQPLGPFLGKSFATSIAPWIVPLEALEPFRVRGPRQEPPPLPYLAQSDAHAFDIGLRVEVCSERMREAGVPARTLSRTSARAVYWSMAQQLAHLTSNGSRVRAGDIYGSGTISGSQAGSYGSMAELTLMGRELIDLPDGTRRAFLEDGDTVTMSGLCAREGAFAVGFGSVSSTILPALP